MPSIQDIIQEAANRYGVDPATLRRTAEIESGLNPGAQNPSSSAGGLFQFIDPTWAQYGKGGSKHDAAASADAAARLHLANANHFRTKLGRDPEGWESYLMHQQGAGGGTSLLGNPNAPAATIVGDDAVRLNGGHSGMTAREFAALWQTKFGGASPIAAAAPDQPMPQPAQPVVEQPEWPAGSTNLGALVAQMAPQPAKRKGLPPMQQQQTATKRPDLSKIFGGVTGA